MYCKLGNRVRQMNTDDPQVSLFILSLDEITLRFIGIASVRHPSRRFIRPHGRVIQSFVAG